MLITINIPQISLTLSSFVFLLFKFISPMWNCRLKTNDDRWAMWWIESEEVVLHSKWADFIILQAITKHLNIYSGNVYVHLAKTQNLLSMTQKRNFRLLFASICKQRSSSESFRWSYYVVHADHIMYTTAQTELFKVPWQVETIM